MKHSPAFQFYADQWLGSTKIATMTPAEEGAYVRLLCHCWNDSDCTLPDDDAELAVLSRLGEDWFKGGSTKLRKCFESHPRKKGRIFNARLFQERKKQLAWRKKSQEGGKLSAKARALKAAQNGRVVEGSLNGGSRVVAKCLEPKGNSSSSSSSSSLKMKEEIDAAFDTFWAAYPKKKSKGQAEKVWAKLQPGEVLFAIMLQKIAQASQTHEWKKENGKFIPHPATWLNAKGWEDELAAPQKERMPL